MRKLLTATGVVGLALLAVGLALPGRSEVVRETHLGTTPERVLAAVGALQRSPPWCSWKPARSGRLMRTSVNERGVWYEVTGGRRRRAALLVEQDEVGAGVRVTWSDVEHYGLDPFARWAGLLLRERLVGQQLEDSLDALARQLSDDAP